MQQLFPNGINKDFLTRFVNSENAQNKPGTLSYYFSPITGDLYDFNCSEFKKGQLYIAPITDTAFMEKELKSIQEKTGYPSTPELGKDIFYVYYRIYGEDQVVAETIIWGFNEKRCKNLADKYSKVG